MRTSRPGKSPVKAERAEARRRRRGPLGTGGLLSAHGTNSSTGSCAATDAASLGRKKNLNLYAGDITIGPAKE